MDVVLVFTVAVDFLYIVPVRLVEIDRGRQRASDPIVEDVVRLSLGR